MELLTQLGIDWKLLLAQVVNFTILVLVLWKLLYKPLLKMMRTRQETIAKGLDMAKEAEERSSKTQEDYEATIAKARKESGELLEQTKKDADVLRQEMLAETNAKVDEMLARARDQLASQKKVMLTEAKSEISSLVIQATERVASAKLDQEGDAQFIQDALSSLQQSSKK